MTPESPADPSADPSAESGPVVHDITDARREARLSAEFSLVRVHAPVYIQDQKAARLRTANAARVALHRERQAEKGLIPTTAPAEVVAAVKAAGGWEPWAATQHKTVEVPIDREVIKEVRVEVPIEVVKMVVKEVRTPAQLSPVQQRALLLGTRLEALKGWRRLIAFKLLGMGG